MAPGAHIHTASAPFCIDHGNSEERRVPSDDTTRTKRRLDPCASAARKISRSTAPRSSGSS